MKAAFKAVQQRLEKLEHKQQSASEHFIVVNAEDFDYDNALAQQEADRLAREYPAAHVILVEYHEMPLQML